MVDTTLQRSDTAGTKRRAPPRSGITKFLQRKSTIAFWMTLPLIVLISVLVIYPAFYSLHLATLNQPLERFVGLGNFEFLFKRETFWKVVYQSCLFAITAVIFKALIGFIVAHFVHNIPAKGQRKWRGMLLVPWVIPPAMSTLAWLWLFDLPLLAQTLYLSWHWQLRRSFEVRLLAVLHVAFAWTSIALALYAVQSLALLADVGILRFAPLHALTIGLFGSMVLGMASRVTLGHSGAELEADGAILRDRRPPPQSDAVLEEELGASQGDRLGVDLRHAVRVVEAQAELAVDGHR